MTDATQGLVTTMIGTPPRPVPIPVLEPPLTPRARALVVGLRAALLMLVDALGDYAGLPKRAMPPIDQQAK